MQKKILVLLTDGFEEIEFVSIVDVLRRAGLAVFIVGLDGKRIYQGAHHIALQSEGCLMDLLKGGLGSMEEFDGVVLPGGGEAMQRFCASGELKDLLLRFYQAGKLVGAICAAPVVLHEAGLPLGDFTCYPSCEELIGKPRNEASVVQDGNILTASGPAMAMEFALALVGYLCGGEQVKILKSEMLVP